MTHELKIWPEHYMRVASGTKTFEIRVNDRAFQRGDKVCLRPWDPKSKDYIYPSTSEHNLSFWIGDVYPIDAERVVFSLLSFPPKEDKA